MSRKFNQTFIIKICINELGQYIIQQINLLHNLALKGVAIFNPLISEMYPKCIQKQCCFREVYDQKTGLKRMIFGTRLQGGNFMSNPRYLVSELTYPLVSENATPF
ncbi:Hypothetical_protein [Hexamita inflata]|uniref:Hypothetical_protein n=1 Tax=Hexamita inflata TaxID=28002 RepID=A0AA86PBV1_9EUKA|nr:Hypothetical protein HINF_LOCUS23719 [Hexamita inflata]